MNAMIYMRWSSAEQGKGSSLERQRQECMRYATAKGWQIEGELIDDGVSAFKGQHAVTGKLGMFVRDVEEGRWPHGIILLVEKLDRLSRQEAKLVFLWMVQMTEMGVVIATVDGDRRYDKTNIDMASIIEVVVKAQLSHEESSKKSQRLGAAWAAKRAQLARGEGGVMTRRAPAWLAVEGLPPSFVVIEDRAAIVRRIFEETASGFGKHHIARKLNLEGVDTFGRASGWHASYIQKILRSQAVLGEFQPGRKARGEARTPAGDTIRDYYPAVVDADLHARAMRSMTGRRRIVLGRGRRLANVMSGLATCGHCGSKMTFRGKGLKQRASGEWVNEDYLVCDSRQRGRGCNNSGHFNYEFWEGVVLDACLEDAVGDKHFAADEEIRKVEIDIAECERAIAGAKRRAGNALQLYVETQRLEAKELWSSLMSEVDEHEDVIERLREWVVIGRGKVSPAAHRKRIATLRGSMRADDEHARFEARALVMEALHDLIDVMKFSTPPTSLYLATQNGHEMCFTLEGGELDCVTGEAPD